eukprot:11176299-Lingulodinium_polyedra.AAC.2
MVLASTSCPNRPQCLGDGFSKCLQQHDEHRNNNTGRDPGFPCRVAKLCERAFAATLPAV